MRMRGRAAEGVRLEVIDNKRQHFAVYFDKPGRIEVMRVGDAIVATAYEGTSGPDQEPLLAYDGTIASEMESVGM